MVNMDPPTIKDEKEQELPQSEGMEMSAGTLTPEGSGSRSGDEFTDMVTDDVVGAVDVVDVDTRTDTRQQEDASEPLVDGDTSKADDNQSKDGEGNKDDTKALAQEQEPNSTPEDGENEKVDPAPGSCPPPETIVYDPDGDLVLVIRDDYQEEYHLQVSSKILASTSPVWRDLIPTTPASASEKMTISLTDDFLSLTIFLRIIHVQFKYLPFSIKFQEVYNLARFSEKYKVYEILFPFVGRWIEPFLRDKLDPERVEWVLIAWEFCMGDVFTGWVEYFCQTAETDVDGKVLYRGREVAELFPRTCREKCSKFSHSLFFQGACFLIIYF